MRKFMRIMATPAILLTLWLFLNDSLSAGHIVLGILLAALFAWAAHPLRPLKSNMKRPLTIVKLFFHVVTDIIRSNIAVARLIWLGKDRANITPGFLCIPLTMRDPHGLAGLACIVTFTPGTVWTDYSEKDGTLTLHVLDLKDEQAWRNTIQERYERPLREIFES